MNYISAKNIDPVFKMGKRFEHVIKKEIRMTNECMHKESAKHYCALEKSEEKPEELT